MDERKKKGLSFTNWCHGQSQVMQPHSHAFLYDKKYKLIMADSAKEKKKCINQVEWNGSWLGSAKITGSKTHFNTICLLLDFLMDRFADWRRKIHIFYVHFVSWSSIWHARLVYERIVLTRLIPLLNF